MRVLALDLATKTGWALWDGSRMESGVQDFTKSRGDSNGMLFYRFNAWLNRVGLDITGSKVLDLCVFEQAHHRGGSATEIAVNLVGRVMEFCAFHHVEHSSVHSMTLKKWATGSGKSDKSAMKMAATHWKINHYGTSLPAWVEDDNEADAILLLGYALEKFTQETTWNARPAAAAAQELSEPSQ